MKKFAGFVQINIRITDIKGYRRKKSIGMIGMRKNERLAKDFDMFNFCP